MFYTVTFNPAVDYIMNVPDFQEGKTNRTVSESIVFGGKGINVSTILAELGAETTALGFIAGFTGEALDEAVKNSGINSDFIRVKNGITRINIKLKSKTETELNARGPEITDGDVEKLFKKLDKLKCGDTLILSGSIPNGISSDIYREILERLHGRGVRFVVDAEKELLLDTLKYKPYLIKPNIHELKSIFGNLLTDTEIITAAKKLKELGAVNVIVSMESKGAILVDEFGKVHKREALGGKPVNSAGAGDSMIAGFLVGAEKSYEYALLLGVAAGGASASSIGLASKDDIFALMQ